MENLIWISMCVPSLGLQNFSWDSNGSQF